MCIVNAHVPGGVNDCPRSESIDCSRNRSCVRNIHLSAGENNIVEAARRANAGKPAAQGSGRTGDQNAPGERALPRQSAFRGMVVAPFASPPAMAVKNGVVEGT